MSSPGRSPPPSIVEGAAACAAVARSKRLPARIAASLMVLLFLPVHYSVWEKFPVWYHAFFLITLAPAVLLGAAIWAPPRRGHPASRSDAR